MRSFYIMSLVVFFVSVSCRSRIELKTLPPQTERSNVQHEDGSIEAYLGEKLVRIIKILEEPASCQPISCIAVNNSGEKKACLEATGSIIEGYIVQVGLENECEACKGSVFCTVPYSIAPNPVDVTQVDPKVIDLGEAEQLEATKVAYLGTKKVSIQKVDSRNVRCPVAKCLDFSETIGKNRANCLVAGGEVFSGSFSHDGSECPMLCFSSVYCSKPYELIKAL